MEWIINWQKVSEIALDALLTGIVSAGLIYLTYRIGQRQSDKNWERVIEREEIKTKINAMEPLIRKLEKFKMNEDDIDPYRPLFNHERTDLLELIPLTQNVMAVFVGDEVIQGQLLSFLEITKSCYKLLGLNKYWEEEKKFRSVYRELLSSLTGKETELSKSLYIGTDSLAKNASAEDEKSGLHLP